MKRLLANLNGLGAVSALLLVGVASAASAAAAKASLAPITKFHKVETWGWHAELPADWKEWLNQKADEAHPYEGKWGYRSPNKNFRVRIKIRRSEGMGWKERTKTTFEKLYKRIPTFKLLAAKSTKIKGREVFYVLGQVRQLRNTNEHEHLIFRLLVRFPKRKLRMVATFVIANDRLEDAMPIIERFIDTFAIVEPASARKAIENLKTGQAGK